MNIKSKTLKLVSGVMGLAVAFAFVVAPTAHAATAADIQAQITSLMATINSLQSQLTTTTGTAASTGYTFNTNLTVGSKGTDVMNLQKVLNMSADTQVAATGAGSAGHETTTFGPATKAAVIKFQVKYGITPAAGYVGAVTRAKLNTMSGSVVTTNPGTGTYPAGCTSAAGYSSTTGQPCSSTGTTTLPTGGALTVTAATQPANNLAPASAARVPFTTFTLTAGSADVTVNSVTVQRSGLAVDAVFSGVVLLDQNGLQIGIAKTLNSNHQAAVGDPFVVKAGTSMTMTIAGNMAPQATLSSYAGQVASLDVVSVNTTATVAGSFPITGAQMTVNSSLILGSVSLNTSSFDPGSSQTQPTGVTGYKFSAIRLTTGSAEQVKLWSIRWNQSGSAGASDLSNVTTYVNGTAYPTTVSSDGKYYTSTFPGGILIDKGNSIDAYVQGDITGSGSAGRTVKFDIYKPTDVYLTGVTYGYGITAPAGTNNVVTCSSTQACGTFTNGTPWFQANILTVSAGSVTTIQKSASVAAQNVAVNVSNQVLGGYDTNFKGEPVSVQSTVIHFLGSQTVAASGLLTSVSIVDSNGAVVAGPVDAVADTSGTGACTDTTHCQKVTFTDTITYPTGVHTYTIKGKLASTFATNGTIVASFVPSTDWTTVTGQTTGNTVSLSSFSSTVSLNTMTVKSGALAISVATTPSVQNIVAGGTARTFANYQFDASQSGEAVRFSSLPLYLSVSGSGLATELNSCQLWDGTTALNTGSNVVNPSATGAVSFVLDQQYVVPAGTIKTLTLTCNVSSGAGNGHAWSWGIQSAPSGVTGATSSNTINPTVATSNGQLQTIAAGSLAVAIDSNSPSYAIVPAGSTGNVIAAYKFRATNEAVNLNRISLKLTNTASSSASDLLQVTIWNGATQVGTATFTGNSPYATSTFATAVQLPKDTDLTLTVKADLASIGTSLPGHEGALIAVDINGADTTGTQGTGVSSGNTVNASGSTATAGVRMFKSFPTFTYSNASAVAQNGTNDLLALSVTGNGTGDVQLYKLTFAVSTTTATLSSPTFSGPNGSVGTVALNTAGNLITVTFDSVSNTQDRTISSGATKVYTLRGNVTLTGTNSTGSVGIALKADTAYPSLSTLMGTVTQVTASNTIWSPDTLTTSATTDADWTNGYGLQGCFATSGLGQDCFSRVISK